MMGVDVIASSRSCEYRPTSSCCCCYNDILTQYLWYSDLETRVILLGTRRMDMCKYVCSTHCTEMFLLMLK